MGRGVKIPWVGRIKISWVRYTMGRGVIKFQKNQNFQKSSKFQKFHKISKENQNFKRIQNFQQFSKL
jgi:hypothetical protein